MRLLIIDASEQVRFALTELFTTRGHEVHGAADQDDGLRLLSAHRYDLIIVDLRQMKGQRPHGVDVVAEARVRCPSATVVPLTVYESSAIGGAELHVTVDLFLNQLLRPGILDQPVTDLIESAA